MANISSHKCKKRSNDNNNKGGLTELSILLSYVYNDPLLPFYCFFTL